MNIDLDTIRDFLSSHLMPKIKRYGLGVGFFLFGLHLHAQVYEWTPFWDRELFIEDKKWTWNESLLSRHIDEDLQQNQVVTARWLMILGGGILAGAHFGIFHCLGQRNGPSPR